MYFSLDLKALELGAPCLRTGEDECCRSNKENRFAISPPFGFVQPLKQSGDAHIGKDDLLYSVYQFKCKSLLETSSQIHPEITYTSDLGIA